MDLTVGKLGLVAPRRVSRRKDRKMELGTGAGGSCFFFSGIQLCCTESYAA